MLTQKKLLVACLFCMPLMSLADRHYSFCYDPYPPFTLGQSGTPEGGLKVELLSVIFDRLDGVSADVTLLPWKQCQFQARVGQFDGILPLFKNDERSEYLLFSDSVFDQLSVFWVRASDYPDGLEWNNFSELSDLKLGMLIGAFIHRDMEAQFEQSKGIHRGKDVKNLFQLLLHKRVDIVAIDKDVGQYMLDQEGLSDQIHMVGKPIDLKESFIGLSKASDVTALLDDINAVILAIKQDGTLNALRENFNF